MVIAAKMTEDRGPDSLQAILVSYLSQLDLAGHHVRDSRRGGGMPGWPDWVIIGPGGILYRELKAEHGIVEPDQRRMGALISRAGGDWDVWRPRDLFSGVILLQLTAISC